MESNEGESPPPLGLYALDLNPAKSNALRRILPKTVEQEAGDWRGFSVSPDGKLVAVPGTNGLVSVVTLATGELRKVQPVADESMGKYPFTVPVWRATGELCFAVPKGSKMGSTNRIEIVLWSPDTGQTRCLSAKWPNDAVEDWLFPKPE